RPASSMRPVAEMSPQSARSSVDLPAPFGPMTFTQSPTPTVRSTGPTSVVPRTATETSVATTAGLIGVPSRRLHPTAAEQEQEERGAGDGGDDPDGNLGR